MIEITDFGETRPRNLVFSSEHPRLRLHDTFKYPAKFHPPIARALVEEYTEDGGIVLDPFCGSGTLLVEAEACGRQAYGSDVDPVAVFVAAAKTKYYDIALLRKAIDELRSRLRVLNRGTAEYKRLMFVDISDEEVAEQLKTLWVPSIPRLSHWFRNYVIVDLARIRAAIDEIPNLEIRTFMLLAFGATIRAVSNADPVPVSGLEVTKHMRSRDEKGRLIDTFLAFDRRLDRTFEAVREWAGLQGRSARAAVVTRHDARDPFEIPAVDAVITSPPYQNAVDYYRRHQLEMYWLGLTSSHSDRLALLPSYVGRAKTPIGHPDVVREWAPSAAVNEWYLAISAEDVSRARDFRAYFSAMTEIFRNTADAIRSGGRLVVVVGRSRWGRITIPTEGLFKELVPATVDLRDHLVYPIRNRTMSYSRHNGADIAEEHVIVFEKA